MDETLFTILSIAAFVPAVVLHEFAHGYASYRLGDPTAKMRGRLTLNPIAHIDPFGTVLLPLLLALTGGPVFGYAKGVPINPHYYKDYRKGMVISGLAGPATNLALAAASGIVFRVVSLVADAGAAALTRTTAGAVWWVLVALFVFGQINLVLLFFNLIPIPPLDGSRVLPLFLSDRALRSYAQFERYGMIILFGLILLGPSLFRFDLIDAYFSVTVDPLLGLLFGV